MFGVLFSGVYSGPGPVSAVAWFYAPSDAAARLGDCAALRSDTAASRKSLSANAVSLGHPDQNDLGNDLR